MAQRLDLVAQLRGVLEAQLLGRREHLLLERDDELLDLLARHALDLARRAPAARDVRRVAERQELEMSETPFTIDAGVMPCSSL